MVPKNKDPIARMVESIQSPRNPEKYRAFVSFGEILLENTVQYGTRS